MAEQWLMFSGSQIKDNPNAPQVYIVGYKKEEVKTTPTDSLINYKTHL